MSRERTDETLHTHVIDALFGQSTDIKVHHYVEHYGAPLGKNTMELEFIMCILESEAVLLKAAGAGNTCAELKIAYTILFPATCLVYAISLCAI